MIRFIIARNASLMTLQWRHIEHDCVSNHQPRVCLLNRLFRRRSKKTSKLRVTGLCVGNSPHKGPVTRKMFPFDDVIMNKVVIDCAQCDGHEQDKISLHHFGVCYAWWRHQMETFSALLAICAGNSPVPGEFPTQRPVTRSFDVFFDLRLSKRLSKQSWGWWLETISRPLWRHRNAGYQWIFHHRPVCNCLATVTYHINK